MPAPKANPNGRSRGMTVEDLKRMTAARMAQGGSAASPSSSFPPQPQHPSPALQQPAGPYLYAQQPQHPGVGYAPPLNYAGNQAMLQPPMHQPQQQQQLHPQLQQGYPIPQPFAAQSPGGYFPQQMPPQYAQQQQPQQQPQQQQQQQQQQLRPQSWPQSPPLENAMAQQGALHQQHQQQQAAMMHPANTMSQLSNWSHAQPPLQQRQQQMQQQLQQLTSQQQPQLQQQFPQSGAPQAPIEPHSALSQMPADWTPAQQQLQQRLQLQLQLQQQQQQIQQPPLFQQQQQMPHQQHLPVSYSSSAPSSTRGMSLASNPSMISMSSSHSRERPSRSNSSMDSAQSSLGRPSSTPRLPTQLEDDAYSVGAGSVSIGGEGSSYGSSSGGLVGFPGTPESDAMHDSLMLQRLHARRFNSGSSGHTSAGSISSSSLNTSMHSTNSLSNSSTSLNTSMHSTYSGSNCGDSSLDNLRDTIQSGSFGSNVRETIRSGASVRSNDVGINSGSISRGPSKGRGSEMTVQELKELTQARMLRSNGVAEGVSPLLSQSAPAQTPFPQPGGKNAQGKGVGKGNNNTSTKASGKGGKHTMKGIGNGVSGSSKGEHGAGGARPRSASAAASWLFSSLKHRRGSEQGAELESAEFNAASSAGGGHAGLPSSPMTAPNDNVQVRSARRATSPADFANLHLSFDYSAEESIISGSPAEHVNYEEQSSNGNGGINGGQSTGEGVMSNGHNNNIISNTKAASQLEAPNSSSSFYGAASTCDRNQVPPGLNQPEQDPPLGFTRRRTDPGQSPQQPSSWPVLNRMRPPALNLPSFFGTPSNRSRSKSSLSPHSSGEKQKKKNENRNRSSTMGAQTTESGRNLSAGSTGSGDGDSPGLARQVAEWVLGGPSPRSSAEPTTPPGGNQSGLGSSGRNTSNESEPSSGGAAASGTSMRARTRAGSDGVARQQGIAAAMLLSAAMGGESESISDKSISGQRHGPNQNEPTTEFGLDDVYGSPKATTSQGRNRAWTPSALIGRLRSASHSGRFDKSSARGSNSSSNHSGSRTNSRSTSGASSSLSPHSSIDSRQSSTSDQYSSGRLGRSFSSPVTVDDRGVHPRPRSKPLSFLKLLRRGRNNSHSNSSNSSSSHSGDGGGGASLSSSSKKNSRVNSNSSDYILNGGQRVITSFDKNGRDASYGSSIATDSRGSDLRAFYESHRDLDSFSSYPVPTPLEEDELFDADFVGRRTVDNNDNDDDELGLPPYHSAWATEPSSLSAAASEAEADASLEANDNGSPLPPTDGLPVRASDAGAAAGDTSSFNPETKSSTEAAPPSQVPTALATSSIDQEG